MWPAGPADISATSATRYDTTGVDIDPGMLGEAQRNLPEVTLVEADMRTLSLDRTFDAVVCLFSSIGYLRSPEELDQAVGAMAGHLSPGGVLIIDGWIRPDAWISGGTTQVTVASSDEVEVVRMSRSERQGDKTYLEMHHLVGTARRDRASRRPPRADSFHTRGL